MISYVMCLPDSHFDETARFWPDLSPVSQHPHAELNIKGTHAWPGERYEYEVNANYLQKLLDRHGIQIGFDLAATARNAKSPAYNNIRSSFKQVRWSKLCANSTMLYLCWPVESGKIQAKARREGVCILLLTTKFEGELDQYTTALESVPGANFSPIQPDHAAILLDYRKFKLVGNHRCITSNFYGKTVYHRMTASEVSRAYRTEYWPEEVVYRGLLHPDMPVPACCARLRDFDREEQVWKQVVARRGPCVYNIQPLLRFLVNQEPLAVEVAILSFQTGVHQCYFGQSHRSVLCKDNKLYRANRAARISVLAKEIAADRFVLFGPRRPMPNIMKFPWGVVPKADGDFRRTTNDGYGKWSINKHIPKMLCEMDSLDTVVDLLVDVYVHTAGSEELGLFKNDFRHAFRNVFVRVQDLHTNGGYVQLQDLIDAHKLARKSLPPHLAGLHKQERVWLIDANNNNGRRSCPALWCLFSRIFIQALRESVAPSEPLLGPLDVCRALLNYVDDNIVASVMRTTKLLATKILQKCDEVLSPEGHHKHVGPTQRCRILGPMFDVSQASQGKILASIPDEKKVQCMKELAETAKSGGASLQKAQSLVGKINWHAVVAPQLSRVLVKLYAWTTALNRIVTRQGKSETQFMRVPKSVNKHVTLITTWYQVVMKDWENTNLVTIAATGRPSSRFTVFTDANGGKAGDVFDHGGLGWHSPELHVAGAEPFTVDVLQLAFQQKATSSTWLEWLAFTVAILSLEANGKLEGAHVTIFADSEPMQLGFENGSAAPHMYPFLLIITKACILASARIKLKWIDRDKNEIADQLGRGLRPPQLPTRTQFFACNSVMSTAIQQYLNLCQALRLAKSSQQS